MRSWKAPSQANRYDEFARRREQPSKKWLLLGRSSREIIVLASVLRGFSLFPGSVPPQEPHSSKSLIDMRDTFSREL